MTNTELIRQKIEKLKQPFTSDIQDSVYPAYLCALLDMEEFINSLPEETSQGWISVKDRLPKNSEYVLTCSNLDGVPQSVGFNWYKDGKWMEDIDEPYSGVIDYWMPIPKFKED